MISALLAVSQYSPSELEKCCHTPLLDVIGDYGKGSAGYLFLYLISCNDKVWGSWLHLPSLGDVATVIVKVTILCY